MFAQQCTLTAPVPRPWAWAALTDGQNLACWSPVSDIARVGRLGHGEEISCTIGMLGQSVGATLSVIEMRSERSLAVRIETLAATVFETVTLEQRGASQTDVVYDFDVITPVPGPAMQEWFQEHALATCEGLASFLRLERAAVGPFAAPVD